MMRRVTLREVDVDDVDSRSPWSSDETCCWRRRLG